MSAINNNVVYVQKITIRVYTTRPGKIDIVQNLYAQYNDFLSSVALPHYHIEEKESTKTIFSSMNRHNRFLTL